MLFSSVVRQMPGYNSQRRDTARTLPNLDTLVSNPKSLPTKVVNFVVLCTVCV